MVYSSLRVRSAVEGRGAVIDLYKVMGLSPVLKAGEGVQLDPVNGPENTFFNIGIGLFQLTQQQLDLLALALAHAVPAVVPIPSLEASRASVKRQAHWRK